MNKGIFKAPGRSCVTEIYVNLVNAIFFIQGKGPLGLPIFQSISKIQYIKISSGLLNLQTRERVTLAEWVE